MKGFSEIETNLLIEEAQKTKKRGESLICCFKKIADKLNRAEGSVRNYYYTILKSANNTELKNKVENANLKAEKIISFSKVEEEAMLYRILEGVKSGKSVRAAIRQIAAGNEKYALRLQNKYRNIVKNNPQLFEIISERVFGEKRNEQNITAYRPTSKQVESVTYAINRLIDRLTQRYKKENEELKQKIKNLNEKIELLSPTTLAEKYFIKNKAKNKIIN